MQKVKSYHKKPARPDGIFHPFLYTDSKKRVYNRKHYPVIGLVRERANRHHLYPKDRVDIKGINKEKFLLRLWEHRHFKGWNPLFQFCYMENGKIKCSELTIDEIITLMVMRHSFIVNKVGTEPWKILFREKNLTEALDLLCRMLAFKFNNTWSFVFPKNIKAAIKQAA